MRRDSMAGKEYLVLKVRTRDALQKIMAAYRGRMTRRKLALAAAFVGAEHARSRWKELAGCTKVSFLLLLCFDVWGAKV